MLRTSSFRRNVFSKLMGNFKKPSPFELKIAKDAKPESQHYYTPPADVKTFDAGEVAVAFKSWAPLLKSLKGAPGVLRKGGNTTPQDISWARDDGQATAASKAELNLKQHVQALPSWARKSQFSNVDISTHVQELVEAFRVYDKNNDGFITADELKKAMEESGQKFSFKDIEVMIEQADHDKDGKINFTEFVKLISAK